jgi:hypothetical protein
MTMQLLFIIARHPLLAGSSASSSLHEPVKNLSPWPASSPAMCAETKTSGVTSLRIAFLNHPHFPECSKAIKKYNNYLSHNSTLILF